jgi:hypothetical protein
VVGTSGGERIYGKGVKDNGGGGEFNYGIS